MFTENFFWKDLTNFRHWKMTLKLRILRSLTRLFIILVSLMRSLFSEKMLVSNRCISGLMPNLIKKSQTVSFLASPPLKVTIMLTCMQEDAHVCKSEPLLIYNFLKLPRKKSIKILISYKSYFMIFLIFFCFDWQFTH